MAPQRWFTPGYGWRGFGVPTGTRAGLGELVINVLVIVALFWDWRTACKQPKTSDR